MIARTSLALVALSTCLLAQSQSERPVFKGGVDVVQIDVSVLDGKRKPVRGLTQHDFTVLEDGKPRDIVAFTPVELPARTPAPAAGAAAWTRDVAPDAVTNDVPAEGRLVIIVFDWSIRFDDSTLARKIARATVNDLGPGDEAAVIFTSEFANAGVPHNFTADRQALLQAIDQPMAFAMKGDDSVRPQIGGFLNANGQLIEDPYGFASGGCRCRVCTLDAMTRIAQALRAESSRRKVMIFIGTVFHGFDAADRPSRVTSMPPPPPTGNTFTVPDALGPGSCSLPLKEARERMSLAAGRANLTIHVVDPVGLETLMNSPLGGASADTIQERQANLHQPADMTGGRTVLNTNTPEAAIPAILDESQAYYLLGFQASDPNGKTFHHIVVKVNRPNVQVRSRTGYAGGDESLARAAASSGAPLTTAIGGVLPATDMPLALVAAPFATPGRSAGRPTGTVAVTLGVQPGARGPDAPGAGVRPSPETLHVIVAALDPKGRLVASREQTATFSSAAGDRYDLLSRLDLAPGRYEIRVATDAPSGLRGSVFTFVDVPDFERDALTLTGVAIGSSVRTPAAPVDLLEDLIPIVPTARRTFGRSEQVSAFARVQQGGMRAEPVTVGATVVDRGGKVIVNDTRTFGADLFAASRTADYRLDVRMARLEPGDYLLSIQASAGKHETRRNVRFSVQ